ncbi:MAG TPA: serine hydrolase [Thermoanaerobaculia bacterium]|nr:serine hydrolase [Thermoanaerobaculia bacterium]
MSRRFVLLAVVLFFASSVAASDCGALAGLWKAKRWLKPHIRSTLIIQRSGDAYTADLAGRAIAVTVKGRELSFQVPALRGSFRGKVDAAEIAGFWYQPNAIPVRLHNAGANRWMGTVETVETTLTFYLLVQKRPDGSLGVLVDNPELDRGVRIGADTVVCEGNVVKLVGKSVVATGTYDAEEDVITLPLADWGGGTYDFKRDNDDSDFYERGKSSARYVYHQPPALSDGWRTQSPEEARIDRSGLEATIQTLIDRPIDSNDVPLVDALLVARHGKLVLEEYFRGQDRDTSHALRSAQKSMVSVLAGAVMQKGGVLSVSSPVYKVMNGGTFPPDLDPRKRAMTLEHLLTMTSGLSCDDWDDAATHNEDEMWDHADTEPDFYRYALNLPMAGNPGEKAFYCSAGANLASGVIGRATGESVIELFDRLVARPMKIDHYLWPLNGAGQPYGAGGASFRARDFLKFGQLMLNGGTWNGTRILSRDYVARSTSPLYALGRFHYGYLWWIHDYAYKGRTVRAFWAGGNGGQSVIVIPELDFVVATYGSNYFSAGGYYVQLEVIPKSLLPAIRDIP